MKKLCLTLARFALSAWIGAAVLFVVTSIREARSQDFGSDIKSILAALRFPAYYLFGFVLVAGGSFGSAIGISRTEHPRRWHLAVASLVLSLGLMIADYVLIFTPMYEIVTRRDGVREARFLELHQWSTRINSVDLTLCAIAAFTVCWPIASRPPTRDS